jgi:hypothetical protein
LACLIDPDERPRRRVLGCFLFAAPLPAAAQPPPNLDFDHELSGVVRAV